VTELELGAELENSQYIGPYPPGGVHTYEVMIFALKTLRIPMKVILTIQIHH